MIVSTSSLTASAGCVAVKILGLLHVSRRSDRKGRDPVQ